MNYKHPLLLPSVKRIVSTTRSERPIGRIRSLPGFYYGLGEDVLPRKINAKNNNNKDAITTASSINMEEDSTTGTPTLTSLQQQRPNMQLLEEDSTTGTPTLTSLQQQRPNMQMEQQMEIEQPGYHHPLQQPIRPAEKPPALITPSQHYQDSNRESNHHSRQEEGEHKERRLLQFDQQSNANVNVDADDADTNVLFRETIKELRRTADTIRGEMELLRKEIRDFYQDYDNDHHRSRGDQEAYDGDERHNTPASRHHQRRYMFDRVAMSVEQWAGRLAEEAGGEEHGWKAVQCNSFLKRKYNPNGSTFCFLKVCV
jgi:hypothetical protein